MAKMSLEDARAKAVFETKWADIEAVELMGEAPMTDEDYAASINTMTQFLLGKESSDA